MRVAGEGEKSRGRGRREGDFVLSRITTVRYVIFRVYVFRAARVLRLSHHGAARVNHRGGVIRGRRAGVKTESLSAAYSSGVHTFWVSSKIYCVVQELAEG